jgi:hypothetical protein
LAVRPCQRRKDRRREPSSQRWINCPLRFQESSVIMSETPYSDERERPDVFGAGRQLTCWNYWTNQRRIKIMRTELLAFRLTRYLKMAPAGKNESFYSRTIWIIIFEWANR